MLLRKNKVIVAFLDLLGGALFVIPLAIDTALRKKNTSLPRSILIIELWGIGDLVMMSSVLKPLREHYPQAHISLLAKDTARELFASSPYIDDFIIFDFPWTRFRKKYAFWKWDWAGLLGTINKLRQKKLDLVIDARGDIRNNLLSLLINGKRRIGYNWTGGGYFLTDALSLEAKNMHRVDAWLSLLNHLGIETDKYKPSLYITQEEEKTARDFLIRKGIKNGELLVGIHPGAKMKSRCWPLANFATVAEHIRDTLGAKIIVFIEPEGYGEEIPIRGDFIKGKIPLREMACLVKLIDLLVCNDSGAMHIAAAVDTKTLSVFGPGDYKRIGPYGMGHTIVADNEVNCRPCFDSCKHDKALCLDKISVDMVVNAANSILIKSQKEAIQIESSPYLH